MTAPIFVLGPPRSGCSVVAGLLARACGVATGPLMPPTREHPIGSFEAQAVVDGHADLLRQLDRDWTCPPASFQPESLELSSLREQVELYRSLDEVWMVKDPSSMFLLGAWKHLGVDRARLVAVVRRPGDAIRSLVRHSGVPQLHAEAIVEAYIARLAEIAEQASMPVITFPGDVQGVVEQVRDLASMLDLPWDQNAADELHCEGLVKHRGALRDTSPSYDLILERSPAGVAPAEVDLGSLRLGSEAPWPLATHVGPRHAQHRNELWTMADLSAHFTHPEVVELVLEGAQPGRPHPVGIRVHTIAVSDPRGSAGALLDSGVRPHAVVGHHLLTDLSAEEVERLLEAAHAGTRPLARLLLDAPDPDERLRSAGLAVETSPRSQQIRAAADATGWEVVEERRLSPSRVGLLLAKQVEPASAEVSVLDSLTQRLAAMEERIADLEAKVPSKAPAQQGDDEGDARPGRRGRRRWSR